MNTKKNFKLNLQFFCFSVNNNKLSSNLITNIYLDNNIYIKLI